MQEPYAIAVLLQNDLVLIDLLTPGFPCFESPYPMDLHESQVTCCIYLADCPSELVPAFYSVGRSPNNRRTGFSEREWPISGGEWSPASCSYSEIIITGHQDGSVKFWDASAGTLQVSEVFTLLERGPLKCEFKYAFICVLLFCFFFFIMFDRYLYDIVSSIKTEYNECTQISVYVNSFVLFMNCLPFIRLFGIIPISNKW